MLANCATGTTVSLPDLGFAPWRLTGTVYGVALNDPATLARLGPAVDAPPYKAAPRAPVLYVKPRNTLAVGQSVITLGPAEPPLQIGATLAMVVGRPACRVPVQKAKDCIAGYLLAADCSVRHDNFYRPAVRLKARDGTCLLGERPIPASAVDDLASLMIHVSIDGGALTPLTLEKMQRDPARLLADVSEFMSLRPGDLLLLGIADMSPNARVGSSFRVEAQGMGRIEGRVASVATPNAPAATEAA